jgi:hypothetical protein
MLAFFYLAELSFRAHKFNLQVLRASSSPAFFCQYLFESGIFLLHLRVSPRLLSLDPPVLLPPTVICDDDGPAPSGPPFGFIDCSAPSIRI